MAKFVHIIRNLAIHNSCPGQSFVDPCAALRRSRSPRRKKRSPTPRPSKVHVGRLTRNVNKEHIMEIFSTYGPIKSVDLPMDRIHPEFNRAFVYIEYENPDDAEKAIKHMDGGECKRTLYSNGLALRRHDKLRWHTHVEINFQSL